MLPTKEEKEEEKKEKEEEEKEKKKKFCSQLRTRRCRKGEPHGTGQSVGSPKMTRAI